MNRKIVARRHWKKNSLLGAFVLFVLLLPGIADAYFDPGFGSYVVQVLVSVLIGSVVLVGVLWRRVIGFFSRVFGGTNRNEDKPQPPKE